MTRARKVHDSFARPTIPVRYLREMLEGVPERDRRALLEQAGLGSTDLDDGVRVSGVAMELLHHAVARRTDDELYGAFVRAVPRGSYATVLKMGCQAPDLRRALAIATDFYALFDRRPPWRLSTRGDELTLVLDPRARQRTSLLYIHTMLLSVWRTASWLVGQDVALLGLELGKRFEDYAAESRFLFGIEPRWHRTRNSLRLPAEVLDRPVTRPAAQADAWARESSFATLLGRPPRSGIEILVRGLLWETADITAPQVARELGMSRAVLSRRLAARGTNFRALRDEVRRERAIAWLASGRSIADVAADLGYSEASAFSRAFKAWTGVAPARYRSD